VSVSFKSRFFLLPPPTPHYRYHSITDTIPLQTVLLHTSSLQTLATMVKGQRVRFHSNEGRGTYDYACIATRKNTLVIVTLKSPWNFLESSKGLYKCDISTILSNYSKYYRFSFFYADNDLIIDINEHVRLY